MKKKELIKKFNKLTVEWITILDVYKTGRRKSFLIETYVKKISNVLFYNYSWDSFDDTTMFRKMFDKWTNMGIFKVVHHDLYSKYCKNRTFNTLFIDSMIIQNYNCSDEEIDYYYKIKSKKQLKLNSICDSNNIIHSYCYSNPKEHDVTHVPALVKNVKCNLSKNALVVGDKGYRTENNKFFKQQNKIKKILVLICPKKKKSEEQKIKEQKTNEKKDKEQNNKRKYKKSEKQKQKEQKNKKPKKIIKRLTEAKKKILKKRYIVEQTYSHVKRTYLRLSGVYEKSVEKYDNFFVLSQIGQLIRNLF